MNNNIANYNYITNNNLNNNLLDIAEDCSIPSTHQHIYNVSLTFQFVIHALMKHIAADTLCG